MTRLVQDVAAPSSPASPTREPAEPPRDRRAELRRIAILTWTLAITDWRLRFYGSVLGVLWTLVKPFAFFGVIYVVFTQIASLDTHVNHYATYILFAMVLFNFFAEVTGMSVQAFPFRENLLRKMHFPPIVIPLSIAVTALLNLGMTLIAVFIFALINGVYPMWTWLELPILIVLLTTLALGIGMSLSALYVRFRDIQPIWDVLSQILFYISAVLFVATSVPQQYYQAFLMNPLAAINSGMRHIVVDNTAPSIFTALPDGKWLIPFAIVIFFFVSGLWIFYRESPRVAEHL